MTIAATTIATTIATTTTTTNAATPTRLLLLHYVTLGSKFQNAHLYSKKAS